MGMGTMAMDVMEITKTVLATVKVAMVRAKGRVTVKAMDMAMVKVMVRTMGMDMGMVRVTGKATVKAMDMENTTMEDKEEIMTMQLILRF